MSIYEIILDIIGKKGPATIPSILQDMNESAYVQEIQEKPIQLSQVKAAINRKKDLFSVEDNLVSILPEKELVSLSISINHFDVTYMISIDFTQKTFQFFEWYFQNQSHPKEESTKIIGSFDEFTKEIYRLKIWNWDEDFQSDEVHIGGTSWEVKLVTKATTYDSRGYEKYPKEWRKFCLALSKLIGTSIL
ncbi:hypothetical protein [Bacillus massilinigeriensis]|uniref:hypothetical protein n=1 Tax=Bacillus massilionigeriensis TaxID=1805475 RepID=UPI00096AF8FC|nr:hypothetical protein [Bacillus massilionigeriensis]